MATIKKLTTTLWFNTEAEDAAKFYAGIFKKSKVGRIARFTAAGQEFHKKEPGSVMTVEFSLEGQPFVALNGGPDFKFNEAISFVVNCADQAEVDYFWDKLGEGGDPAAQQCGWLKDKFGVSWQVVPIMLTKLATDRNRKKAERGFEAMMRMKKIDIAELEAAVQGELVH